MGAEGQGSARFTATDIWTLLGGWANADVTPNVVRNTLRRMNARHELVERGAPRDHVERSPWVTVDIGDSDRLITREDATGR